MAAGEQATRPANLVSAARVGMQDSHASRPRASRAAALLLASSLLLLGVASVAFLAGNQGRGMALEEAETKSGDAEALAQNPREEAAEKLQKWTKEVDDMESQVKQFQATANERAVDELVHLERVKDLLDELKKQVPETPPPKPIHWGYGDGPDGPAHWGEINAEYETCASGKSQSPINFELNIKDAPLPSLGWQFSSDVSVSVSDHKGSSAQLGREFYNGHTFEVEDVGGPTILIEDTTYTLRQFHVHTPSEHRVAGRHFDMEMHFVHTTEVDGETKVAVVGAFYEIGDTTPSEVKKLLRKALPDVSAEPTERVEDFDIQNLLQEMLVGTVPSKLEAADAFVPNFKNYYQYDGSFTTPPCTEGVKWVVFKNPISIEAADLDAVKQLEGKNNRPVQPLNGRMVLDVGGVASGF